MNITVLEILALPETRFSHLFYHLLLTKQFASIMPQVVSVWCRRLGHQVNYVTYYGIGDPLDAIPVDTDWVFISCYTQVSPLAYALAKILRIRGTITVLGGPHAKSFPVDALRFFDYVVKECNQQLISNLLNLDFPPKSILNSSPLKTVPSVQERLPEIEIASLFFRRFKGPTTTISLLSSLGCPYTCDFCIDWNSQYRMLPRDHLIRDLQFIYQHFSRTLIAFQDPNFGIKFDDTLSALETQKTDQRLPYVMESSLSVLKPERMSRLKTTNCVFVAPGIESWTDYSNKSSGGAKSGIVKVEKVVSQFQELHQHVSNLQANFIFGLDIDAGREPVELTKLFMDQVPFVWPTMNIPIPFGGTPMFVESKKNNRILEEMPFRFYYAPYSVMKTRNYDPCTYYRLLIELMNHGSSTAILRRRMKTRKTRTEKVIDFARARSLQVEIQYYRKILTALETDKELYNFHQNGGTKLPVFYQNEYRKNLGRYSYQLTSDDRRPVLE